MRRSISSRYAVPNPSTGEKRILTSRVLVGRSCLGNWNMTICLLNYDSTSNQSYMHAVYSTWHVLP
ncbi:unnamed protein product, partial [Rotaria sp. Silwood2]